MWPRLLGITGGLGPLAHIELERRLVDAARERCNDLHRTPTDQDYPPWVLASLPQTPDRTEALEMRGPSPLPMLLRALGLLELCQCHFALVPCNTAHAWLPELRRKSRLPILDMVEETVREAVRRWGRNARMGLLATNGTVKHRVYPDRAAAISKGIQFLSPWDLGGAECPQERVMNSIYGPPNRYGVRSGGIKSALHVGGGRALEEVQRDLCEVIALLVENGVQAVILGCTELPLVLDQATVSRRLGGDIPLVQPLEIAARAAIRIAAGEQPLPH